MWTSNTHVLTRATSLGVTVVAMILLRDYMRVTWEISGPIIWIFMIEVLLFGYAVLEESDWV